MAAAVPDQGEIRMLQAVKDISPQRIILFQNNITPGNSTTFADLTEATFSGYARVTPSWGAIATGGDGRAAMVAAAANFTHNGGVVTNLVYGWAWIDSAVGVEKLIAADRVPSAPKTMAVSGDSITVTVTGKLRQEP